MVTNIPQRCVPYWNNYEEAKTTKDKITALEELIACIPKHKGTEKLLKDLKMKLAKLRAQLTKEFESRPKPKFLFSVSKKGDAQVVLLGTPASGKTSIVNSLCNANYATGKTTTKPQEGIFKWRGCEFQIVDLPPIISPNIDKVANGRAIMGIAYNADIICLVVDPTQGIEWQIKLLIDAINESNMVLRDPPPIIVKRLPRGGITVIGIDHSPFSIEELKEILQSYRITNCIIEFTDAATEYDLYLALNPKIRYKKAIVILTKMDKIPKDEYSKVISETNNIMKNIASKINITLFSIYCDKCREFLGQTIFETLGLIRIWTKKDGIVRRERAIVLKQPATVRKVCEKIHSSFIKRFRYAVVERPSEKIKRKTVGLDYELHDGDIISIYLRD